MVDIFRFKMSLRGGQGESFPANYCTRTIDIKGSSSLEKLARTIIDAYNFDFDHAFGFFDNLNNPYRSNESYTLFADMDDIDTPKNAKGVKKTKLSSAFEAGKTLVFLFDYGDEWIFHVNCSSVGKTDPDIKYPLVIASKGKAPEQYPDYDEEYDDEDSEDSFSHQFVPLPNRKL